MAAAEFPEVVFYNPFTPAHRVDPYPDYHRLRAADPVHWCAAWYCWVLTRHEHVRAVVNDRRFGIRMDYLLSMPALQPSLLQPYNRIIRTQILSSDPPDHSRIRALMARAFAPARLEALRDLIQQVADRLIDAVQARGAMDFIAGFARALPFTLICELLGIPEAERAPLETWTHSLMRSTDPVPMSWLELEACNADTTRFRSYFLELAARRRSDPGEDLFSELVAAVDRGELSEEELVANAILLFCAGHDTVVSLFGNGLLALLRYPDQLELLRADPGLIRNAVEELLRYDTAVQIARRMPYEDVEIGGRRIVAGSYVLCLLGAANRDPEVYPDPDRLDVRRPNVRPLSFGGGVHYCLGAQLARLEGEIGFATLLRRLPGLRLGTAGFEWGQNVFVRGLTSLQVEW